MAVARIISSSFEEAVKFAEYLRRLYDTVEIAQPGRGSDTEVDLEVNLELCTAEQAWQQIAQLGEQPDINIFVAPETVVSATPSAPDEQVTEAAASGGPSAEQEFEAASREVDAAIIMASAAAASAAGSNGHDNGGAADQQLASIEQSTWLGRIRHSLQQWLAVRALLREIRQAEQARLVQEREQQRQIALQFERRRREEEARELAAARAAEQQRLAWQEAERTRHEEEERIRLAAIAERQRAEQQALALRRAEEERRQAAVEEIRRGALVQAELQRVAEEQAALEPAQEPATDAQPEAVPVYAAGEESMLAAAPSEAVQWLPRRTKSSQLRLATALSAVTSVLLMAVWVAYAHRRPASPLSLSTLQRFSTVQQEVPFGPAVLSSVKGEPAAVAEPAAAGGGTVLAAVPQQHNFRHDFQRVTVDGHEVDYIAEDVTVRHFHYKHPAPRYRSLHHPASEVPITASSRGVKQISDME